jgi:hypothetical protein
MAVSPGKPENVAQTRAFIGAPNGSYGRGRVNVGGPGGSSAVVRPCQGLLTVSHLSRHPDIMSKDLSAWEAWDQLIHRRDANPLEVLRGASQFQRYFDAVQGAAAKAARGEGSTWDEIGQALGVTRQAAWERFATSEHEQLRKISLERFCGWPRR